MKNYTQAPLPFQGQKRRFVKHLKEVLQKDYNDSYVFIDLFGGSGLLSHTVKTVYPNAKVVYNDFDNYRQRLAVVSQTNNILDELRVILKDYPRGKRIVGSQRDKVLKVLTTADKLGYVDYITLSSNLKFSMNYGNCLNDFINDTLYNSIRRTNYSADGYLKGVGIVKLDYKELFELYKNQSNVVFLVDPPYLSTDSSTYTNNDYWKLRDYLNVLQVITEQNYFYFTSNKSQIVELCEWISSVSVTANPFQYAVKTEVNTTVNKHSGYTDIMYHYKKQ